MKKIIRKGTFETNSSSTHSLTFMSKEEFEKWKRGEIYFNLYEDKAYTKEEFDALVRKDAERNNVTIEDVLNAPRWKYELPEAYEQWCYDEYLEWGVYQYTTEHGDEVVAVCKYGYEG